MVLKSRRFFLKFFGSLPFGILSWSSFPTSFQKKPLFYLLCETNFNRELSQQNYNQLSLKCINKDKHAAFFKKFQNNGCILKTKSVFQPTKNIWMCLFRDYSSYRNWCDVCDENHLYDFQARSKIGFDFKFHAIHVPKNCMSWELEKIYKKFSYSKKDISKNSSLLS